MIARKAVVALMLVLCLTAGSAVALLPVGQRVPKTALAQTSLQVSPPVMTLELLAHGTGEAQFTVVIPDWSGDVDIGVENIPLDYQPKTVWVEAGVETEVVLTFYGDEEVGSMVIVGKTTFLPRSEAPFVPGVKVPTQVIHRVGDVTPTPARSLTLSVDPPDSGGVTLNPTGGIYTSGAEVALTAVPAEGYAFDHWSGDASGTDAEVGITMDADKSVTAHFIRVNPSTTIETSMGTIKFELYEQRAPITTANFIKLAESGFYDGLIFHRVVDDFVIQTGDPTGTGTGGSDETIVLEIDEELTHKDGAVGMARKADPNSATSQFYICDGAQHGLDGSYAVFGQVFEGMDVVRAIAGVSVDANDKPVEDVVMIKVTIHRPPGQPTNVSPLNGDTGVSMTPMLRCSAFSDPDGGDTHAASQWQITTIPGDYSSPVFDSDTDTSNLTTITIQSGSLTNNTTCYWHVRHQDNHGAWSAWSAETCFNTTTGIPQLEWHRTFGGSNQDVGRCVQQTSDGGQIIVGTTVSFGAGSSDVWLIKTDSDGNELWNNTFGGSDLDYGNSVQQTSDGGYIIAGRTWSYGAGVSDVWLIKTDSDGNELWNNTFGGSDHDGGFSVEQTSDGGYIMVGYTVSYGAGGMDAWLIKTDASGNETWNKTFGDSGGDCGRSVQQTSDGGYIIGGDTESYGAGDSDVWLIRTDSNGDQLWDKTFGGSDWDQGQSVQQTSDGSYIVAGYTNSYGAGDWDVWLLKVSNPSNQPSNASPSNGATGLGLTPTLESSAFSDPDTGDTHAASQWQITATSGDYSSPVFDSDTDASNLTSISIPSGLLNYDATYYWHVRHQDNNGAWSQWSAETSFATAVAPNQPPNQPSNTWPLDGATGVRLPPILQSSGFSDPDSGDTHAASQWQISATPGNYFSPVLDSGTDTSNLTSITISSGTLQHAITYYWRVRHQDNNGNWSAWSEETQLTTEVKEVDGGQNGEDGIGDWATENWWILTGAAVVLLSLLVVAISIALRLRREKEVKEWEDEGYRW